jgi:hypothetical protein
VHTSGACVGLLATVFELGPIGPVVPGTKFSEHNSLLRISALAYESRDVFEVSFDRFWRLIEAGSSMGSRR